MVELNHRDINWIPEHHIANGQHRKVAGKPRRDWNDLAVTASGVPAGSRSGRADDPAYPRTVGLSAPSPNSNAAFGSRGHGIFIGPSIDELVRPNPDDPKNPARA